ncbi:MAG: response regulator [Clostridiales bacterium]
MEENIKILLIEDNLGDAYLIEEHLEEFATFSYELNHVGTLNEAFAVLNFQPFDVILLDLELPDSYGINTFLSIHNKDPEIPIIILTGLNDGKVGAKAIKEEAYDFLIKGQTEYKLIERIEMLHRHLNKNLSEKSLQKSSTLFG